MMGRFGRAGSLLLRHPKGGLGLLIVLLVVLMAALAPLLYPDGPWRIAGSPFMWPGADPAFPLGTDSMGRDVAAGLCYGAQVSLLTSLAAAAVSLVLGTVIGALAGFYGGWLDVVLMRLTDAVQTMPGFLFAVVLVGLFGSSLTTIVAAIALPAWPTIARLVRAEFLRLRSADFVHAARILGMSNLRLIATQILPNCLTPIIVSTSVLVASAIIVEAGLSFLGLGDSNLMSWGNMIGAGRSSLRTAWYLVALPGGMVVLTVLGLNIFGDSLNDMLNPRLRARR
ncbi:ABC transporter permease [Consotaella aegiceratis]|uniref:ABC transporter permease n=1 Tax=Consotaella aegiceratis TaxID=3097961 RepID=UPI002F3E7040